MSGANKNARPFGEGPSAQVSKQPDNYSPADSPLQMLLPRLDGVRQVAPDRYMAKCPAHSDESPSLSIRELPDGTLLIHDFGGCGVSAVANAAGVNLRDLFPRHRQNRPSLSKAQRRVPVSDVLKTMAFEGLVVLVIAEDVRRGKALTDADRARLTAAVSRLNDAVGACYG